MGGTTLAPALIAAALTVAPAPASHEDPAQQGRSITGLSPFPPNCTGLQTDPQRHSEVEPFAAVDPNDPHHVVVIHQQDRFAAGAGSQSNLIATTFDGGATWTRTHLPGLSRCTGGAYPRATDPMVSIGADGVVYASSLAFHSNELAQGGSAIVVSTSGDGGRTWGRPVVVSERPLLLMHDFDFLVADPYAPGHAYINWLGIRSDFSRTTDGGRTWSVPRPIVEGSGWSVRSMHVLPDQLVAIGVRPAVNAQEVFVVRSADRGVTWSLPTAGPSFVATEVTDPSTGGPIRAGGFPLSSAADAHGTLHVAVRHDGGVLHAASSDAGRTWSAPEAVVGGDPVRFLPTIAVTSGSAIGVTYYDFRNDTAETETLWTDVWVSWSRDAGATWTERHVSGPFDLRRAPLAPDRPMIGDYEGLVPVGQHDLLAVFARTLAPEDGPYSDIYVRRLTPP